MRSRLVLPGHGVSLHHLPSRLHVRYLGHRCSDSVPEGVLLSSGSLFLSDLPRTLLMHRQEEPHCVSHGELLSQWHGFLPPVPCRLRVPVMGCSDALRQRPVLHSWTRVRLLSHIVLGLALSAP